MTFGCLVVGYVPLWLWVPLFSMFPRLDWKAFHRSSPAWNEWFVEHSTWHSLGGHDMIESRKQWTTQWKACPHNKRILCYDSWWLSSIIWFHLYWCRMHRSNSNRQTFVFSKPGNTTPQGLHIVPEKHRSQAARLRPECKGCRVHCGRLRIIPSPQDMCRTFELLYWISSSLAFIFENRFRLIFAYSPLRWDKALEGRMRSMSAEYGWPADVKMSKHQVANRLRKHPLAARLFAPNRRDICAYESSLCRQDA